LRDANLRVLARLVGAGAQGRAEVPVQAETEAAGGRGEVASALRSTNVVLEAPTGFGKTPVVLSALLPFVERGKRVVWAVRTGSETDRPVEELAVFRRELGLKLVGLSFRGKRDMCLLAKRFGSDLDYSEVSYICSRERSRCRYYRELEEGVELAPLLSRGASDVLGGVRVGERAGVCPYFLQRRLLAYADVVALSYNYVVDEGLSWSVRTALPFDESILVVDEAHNLQGLNLGGDTVTEGTLARALEEAREVGSRGAEELVRHAAEYVADRFSGLKEEESEVFDPQDLVPGGDLELLEEAEKAGEAVRELRYRQGRRPRSSLYHFASFLRGRAGAEGGAGRRVRGGAARQGEPEHMGHAVRRAPRRGVAEVLEGRAHVGDAQPHRGFRGDGGPRALPRCVRAKPLRREQRLRLPGQRPDDERVRS